MTREAVSPPKRIRTAFWNVQNLFDVDGSPVATELEYTPVFGWDRKLLEHRIQQVAGILAGLFDGQGADLIGLCEVESERIAQRLLRELGRSDYRLVSVPNLSAVPNPSAALNPSTGALDTVLIYSDRVFQIGSETARGHVVDHRFPTNDILEAHLRTVDGDSDLMVLVNHWPSRRPSAVESDSLRIAVASHCARIVGDAVRVCRKEYLELNDNDVSLFRLNQRWNRNILVMGDFNDEPWSRSIRQTLNASFSREPMDDGIRLSRGTLPSWKSYSGRPVPLFNPMWSLLSEPDRGTRAGDQSQSLMLTDQFLLSRGICLGLAGISTGESPFSLPDVRIARPDALVGRRGRPKEFRLDAGTGISDHFPITMTLNLC